MHWSKFKLAIVISFDNKEFWQMGYNGPGGPMGPGGRMMGPGKPMGPGGPRGPGDPRGMMGPGGADFDPRGPMMMGPDGPMMGPGGPQNIVSTHSSVQTVTVSQDTVSSLEIFSQCAADNWARPARGHVQLMQPGSTRYSADWGASQGRTGRLSNTSISKEEGSCFLSLERR